MRVGTSEARGDGVSTPEWGEGQGDVREDSVPHSAAPSSSQV